MEIEPFFNFETGEFDFSRGGELRFVTGREALQNRIEKALRTESGHFRIYGDTGYGSKLGTLLGRTLPKRYTLAEIERYVKEVVLSFDEVLGIDGLEVKQHGARVKILFSVQSVYGNFTSEEVVSNG